MIQIISVPPQPLSPSISEPEVGEKNGGRIAIKPRDQHVWAVVLYRAGVADMFGAVRVGPRLHWTQGAAREEAQGWIEEMQIGRR